MFLSTLECAIPKPIPFLRIGLANFPILIALDSMNIWHIILLATLKVIVQGIISGTIFSYISIFSIAGTLSSTLVMLLLHRAFFHRGLISYCGISISGAIANNLAQIAVSYLILFGKNTFYIAPVLLVCSLITSPILGLFTTKFVENSRFFKNFSTDNSIKSGEILWLFHRIFHFYPDFSTVYRPKVCFFPQFLHFPHSFSKKTSPYFGRNA